MAKQNSHVSSNHHIPFFDKGFFADLFDMESEIHLKTEEDRLLLGQAIGELRLTLATQYVSDAIARRKLQEMPHGLSQRVAEYVYTHPWYSYPVYMMIFVAVLWGPFDEQRDGDSYYVSQYGYLVVILDILLGLFALRPSRFFASKPNQIIVGVIAIILLNEFFIDSNTLRGFRILFLVCKSHGLRLTVGGMTRTLPRIWQVIIIYLTVTTFYALLAQEFMHSYYHNLDVEFTDTFNNFPRSWLTMFVLSTTENFPFLVYPPLFRVGGMFRGYNSSLHDELPSTKDPLERTFLHGLVVFFFVTYLVLLVYLILNMKLAAIYDSWKEVHEEQLASSRIHRFHAMLAAHAVLVDDGICDINLDRHWIPLLERVRPELSPSQMKQLFKFIDSDGDSGVGLKEWILRGVDAITFDFSSSAMDSDRFLAELATSANEAREEAKLNAKNQKEALELRASLASLISRQSQNMAQGGGRGSMKQGSSHGGGAAETNESLSHRPTFMGGGGAYGYQGGVDGLTARGGGGNQYGEDVFSDQFISPELKQALAEAETAAAATGPKGDLLLPPLKDVCIMLYQLVRDIVEKNFMPNEPTLDGGKRARSASSGSVQYHGNDGGGRRGSGRGEGKFQLSGGGIVLASESRRIWLNRHVLSKESWRWFCWLLVLAHSLLLVLSTWPFSATSEIIQWIILILFLFQEGVKLVGLPSWRIRTWPKRFDLYSTLALLCAQLVPFFDHTHHNCHEVTTGGCAERLRIQVVVRAIVLLRFLTIGRGARDVIETVYRIRNILGLFVCVFFIIIYFASSIALDLFEGVLTKNFVYDADDTTGADDDVVAAQVNMDTFYAASLQLFQIATTNNWQDIMYANVLEGDANAPHRVAMAAFFVLYFFTMVWFGTNVLTALVIDVYMVAGIRKTEAKKRRAMIAKSKKKYKSTQHAGYAIQSGNAAGEGNASAVMDGRKYASAAPISNSRSGCSRCALNGKRCALAEPILAQDGRNNLCKNCGHGMMYHTQFNGQDEKSMDSFGSVGTVMGNSSKSKSARKWGAIRQLVSASKQLSNGNKHQQLTPTSQSQYQQPLLNHQNTYEDRGRRDPLPGSQQDRGNVVQSQRSNDASQDNNILLQTAWLDLQAHSGLRVDDTVSAHATIDDDLIDPNVLDKLRYNISATCAKLQQRRSALHLVIINRYNELRREAQKMRDQRDRLLGLANRMNF